MTYIKGKPVWVKIIKDGQPQNVKVEVKRDGK